MADPKIIIEFRDMALFVLSKTAQGCVVLFPSANNHKTRISPSGKWNSRDNVDIEGPFEIRILKDSCPLPLGEVYPPSWKYTVNMTDLDKTAAVPDDTLHGPILSSLNGRMVLPSGALFDGPSRVKAGEFRDALWDLGGKEHLLTECVRFEMTADPTMPYELSWLNGRYPLTIDQPLYIFNGDRDEIPSPTAEELPEFSLLCRLAGVADVVPKRIHPAGPFTIFTYIDRPCPSGGIEQ